MEGAPLSSNGGLLTLVDEKGNKVDGMSYTKGMASKDGEWVVFR